MASAFKPPIRIIAHRRDNAAVVYTFDSANKAAAFTHADVKSILQVARGERQQAVGWQFYDAATIAGQVAECEAARLIHNCTPAERQ